MMAEATAAVMTEATAAVDDATRIVPATSAAGPAAELTGLAELGDPSGRAWFDERLYGFLGALTHDQAGKPRTSIERRALAHAAQDMIARLDRREPREGAQREGVSPAVDQVVANTYRIRGLIARGGVGEVYRARHVDLRTEHAIKILLPRHALDITLVTLLLNEARILQSLRHDGIATYHGLLRDSDGRLLLAMEHVRGRTLSDRLLDGPLATPELLALIRRLATILTALHARKIVHNDISPDNIILREDSCSDAVLIDFGLARALEAEANYQPLMDFAGKYSWVSPEHLSGPDPATDARSDLYSLGLVIAAAARGYRLEMGYDLDSARAARASLSDLDGFDALIAPLLHRLLAYEPGSRMGSAREINLSLGSPHEPPPVGWRNWLGGHV
jgi:serine/threonine protein kinase